jgi:hypothetical protein
MKERPMPSSNPNTKLQVNFKLSNGDLINIYADNQQELETHLVTVQDLASLISSVSQSLNGVAKLMEVASPVAAVTSTAAPAASGGYTCKHGEMVFKSGVGNNGPWKGYMCAAPKGAPDKCKAKYL